jgi:hypothetical protein
MSLVAVQPQLDIDRRNLQRIVVAGDYSIEVLGTAQVVESRLVGIDLDRPEPKVVLEVCVDQTAFTGVESGKAWNGPRETAQYRVVRAPHLPGEQWAVSKVAPPAGYDQPKPC